MAAAPEDAKVTEVWGPSYKYLVGDDEYVIQSRRTQATSDGHVPEMVIPGCATSARTIEMSINNNRLSGSTSISSDVAHLCLSDDVRYCNMITDSRDFAQQKGGHGDPPSQMLATADLQYIKEACLRDTREFLLRSQRKRYYLDKTTRAIDRSIRKAFRREEPFVKRPQKHYRKKHQAQSKPGPVESKPKTPTRKPHQISVGLKEWVRLYVDHVLFRTTQQTDTKAFTTRTPIPVFSSTSSIPFPDSRYGSSVSSVTTEHSTISVIHVETQTSRAQVVEHLPARLPKVDSKCVGVTPDCLDEQRSAETGENDKDIEVVKQWLDNTGGAYKEVKSGSSQSSATSRVYEGDDGHLIVPQDRRSSVDTGTKNLHVSEPSNDQSEETIQVPSRPHSKSVRASPTYPEDQAWKLVHRASAPPLSKEQTVALSALTVTPSDEPDVCTLSPLSYQPQTTSRSSSTRIRNPPRALTLPFATDCVSHVPGVGLSDQDALLLRTTDAASRQSRSRTHMHQMVINLGHRICDMLSSTTADDSTAGIWPWCAVGVAVGLVGVYCLTRNSSYPRLLSVDNNNVRSVVWIPSVRLENFVSPD